MKLSYVITTRNRREILLRTLGDLERDTGLPDHEWEVLVVDNGSQDGTADAAAGWNRRVRVICLAENEGVPAKNFALEQARGRYVALLGDNVRPAASTIPRAINYLSRHPRTAAVAGRVLLPDGSAEAPALPAVLMGGASVVRRSIFNEVGPFAIEFFRQVADYELSFRVWRAGYRIERFEDLEFTREIDPVAPSSEPACRMDLRNNLILVERYLPRPLRRAYRHDWLRRYALLALHEGHARAANAALRDARVWARREVAVGRKTLDAAGIEAVFRTDASLKAVAAWAGEHAPRRVAIADWGKNLYAAWSACRLANLEVAAVLENSPAFAGSRYRGTPVLDDASADASAFDGIVLSKINPAQVEPRLAELRSRFPDKPILSLWTGRLIGDETPRRRLGEAA